MTRPAEILIVTRIALLSLPRRLPLTSSMVMSVSLVVCVLAGFLSMSEGFRIVLNGAGSPFLAVMLGGGGNREESSEIPPEALRQLQAMRGDIGVERSEDGTFEMSREIVVGADIRTRLKPDGVLVSVRGMDIAGQHLRDANLAPGGRMFRRGTREIVIGERIAADLGVTVGQALRIGAFDWTVAGIFDTRGSALESEIWSDIDVVRAVFDRQGEIQSVRLKLHDPSALVALQAALASLATPQLLATTEQDLYAEQANGIATLIALFAWPLALAMAVGATAGALNTMMNSVSDRVTEISTLRVLGFSRVSTFSATWIEAVLLAAIGSMIGIALSWVAFNGWQASTIGGSGTRIAFRLVVDGKVLSYAGSLGVLIGAIGGLMPAVAACRLPLAAALRARST